jgi:hypothetical protein
MYKMLSSVKYWHPFEHQEYSLGISTVITGGWGGGVACDGPVPSRGSKYPSYSMPQKPGWAPADITFNSLRTGFLRKIQKMHFFPRKLNGHVSRFQQSFSAKIFWAIYVSHPWWQKSPSVLKQVIPYLLVALYSLFMPRYFYLKFFEMLSKYFLL